MAVGMSSGGGLTLALMAGTMAALGSASAKLAFDNSTLARCCGRLLDDTSCQWVTVALRILSFVAIFGCNSLMWIFFTKSLQHCSSSVEATITNTAANFIVTALLGFLVFGEVLSLRWWAGSSLIVCGLLLIHRPNVKQKTS